MSTKRVPSSVVLLTLLMLSCFSAPVWSQAVAIESVVESDEPAIEEEERDACDSRWQEGV